MNRRMILKGWGLAAIFAPRGARAQPVGKTFTMGLLATSRPSAQPPAGPGSGETVVDALKDLGYVEGRNIVIERRYSEGIRERLPGLAAELVAFKPDVIFTHGTLQTMAVYRATRTIPIVAFSGDLVEQGLVSSLARPGGNVTGLQAMQPEVAGKRLALLKEAIPGLSLVAFFWAGSRAASPWFYDNVLGETARTLRLTVRRVEAEEPAALDTAFAILARERVKAVMIPGSTLAAAQRGHLADLARKHRIASVGDDRAFTEAGFLMSYGPDLREFLRHAATYVDKILKGANPAELPVEQPSKLQLLINLKTAKAIGLTIPPSLLLRADEVIQ